VREERVPLEVVLIRTEPAREHHRQAPLAAGDLSGVICCGRREIICLSRPGPQVPGEAVLGFR
jgi:hypothetical protein